jgi:hypothetical protein
MKLPAVVVRVQAKAEWVSSEEHKLRGKHVFSHMRGCRNSIRLSGIQVGDASTSYGFCGVGQPLMSITRIGNNS